MRKKIAAGNWKMNLPYNEGMELAEAIINGAKDISDNQLVILGTPYIHLKEAAGIATNNPKVEIAAQNCHQAEKGAFTGEISIPMLQSIGIKYVILGHSERREYFHETNEILAEKVKAVLAAGMIPIFCCGESLDVREEGWHAKFVRTQLEKGLFHLSAEEFGKVILAYEPIWAIGTGVTASPQQAQDMHKEIRLTIENQYDVNVAENTSILYGGSVKPTNADELFSQADVDGGLVGGASLKPELFLPIISSLASYS
ncbi:MAG: triose-phosphate isomerase [Saprospiraceae bacterium]